MQEHRTTIVTAIEGGVMEQQVLLLLDSLRAFGGRWSQLPFLAVQPRRGPAISAHTRSELERLGADFVRGRFSGTHSWWDHFNKVAALEYAEQQVRTPYVTWMDADTVVLQEPGDFIPAGGATFVARPAEGWDVASDGRDGSAAYWHELCRGFDVNFDDVPDVVSYPDGRRIKAYFQAGNYTYRRETRLSGAHKAIFESMLDGNLKSRTAGIYHADQASLAVAVQMLGLRFSEHDPRMNFNLNIKNKRYADALPIEDVQVLQYHGSFWPEPMSWAAGYLARLADDRRALIARYAPWQLPGLPVRAHARALRSMRRRKITALDRRSIAY